MDCSIRRLDSRADETREREKGKETTDRSREPCRIMTQHPQILTEQFPLSPHLFAFSLSLSLTRTHRCAMRLSCWEIGWSISLSLLLSVFLSVSPPSIKLLLLLPSRSVSPRHSLPFQSNSENYNPWIYRRMICGENGIITSGQWSRLNGFYFFLRLIPL